MSKQDYGTPWDFLDAVESRFGKLAFDLAATDENTVVPDDGVLKLHYTPQDDSLSQCWTQHKGLLWLNPPFARISPWVKKCDESHGAGRVILLLTPASVGSNWFSVYVYRKAYVLFLRPRLTFRGADDPYKKDCMLSVYGWGPGFDVWRWK